MLPYLQSNIFFHLKGAIGAPRESRIEIGRLVAGGFSVCRWMCERKIFEIVEK
jgi:hypothetical protein